MDWVLLLKILGALVALGIGLYWGMASEFRQSAEDIDRAMDEDRGPQKVRRHFMWLDMFFPGGTARRSRKKRPFRL